MDENLQDKSDFSVLDLIKLLISKIHILLLVVILGGILGGSYAVWKTKDIDYYGTTLEFYVNPKTQSEDSDEADAPFPRSPSTEAGRRAAWWSTTTATTT